MSDTKTIYTDWVKKKHKGKTWWIRGWMTYSLEETEKTKTISYWAGFETKIHKLVMTKKIKLRVWDSIKQEEKEVSKKFEGASDTSSIAYIGSEEEPIVWTYNKDDIEQTKIEINLKGTFKDTRFSGNNATTSLKITLERLSFQVQRLSPATNVRLTIKTVGDSNTTLQEPVVTKTPRSNVLTQSTPTLTWYADGTEVTFPYTSDTAITLTAVDTADTRHTYDYDISVQVGTTMTFTDSSTVWYTSAPLWTVTVNVLGTMPEENHYGRYNVNVYAMDYRTNSYSLLPADDGWEVEQATSTTWNLTLILTDQYVSDPTATTTSTDLYIVYDTFSSAKEINTAIYNTSRIASYSTGLANNVFIGGCNLPKYTSRVWYSAVNNPLYMPDLNYIEVGSADTGVKGLVKVGDYLGVVKQSDSTDTSVFLVYPTSFDDETTFATKPCVGGVGALGEYCFNVLGDETLFLSPRGVMAIEPNEDEQSRVKDRSYYVNGSLLSQPDLERAYSFVWDGFYLLAVNNYVYVLDGNQRNSWGNTKTNLVYECYFLDNIPAKCMFSYDGELWFSDFNGNLCRFKAKNEENPYQDGDGNNVVARWTTVADDDGALQYYKTLQKKGNLVSLLPEKGTKATVYLKRGEDDRKAITQYIPNEHPDDPKKLLPSSVYVKKKMKKYTRLQFIVEDDSDSPLGIDKIVKSYTLGNYAKK